MDPRAVRGIWHLTTALVVILSFGCCGLSTAQPKDGAAAIAVRVQALRDAGGLPTEGQPVNERLTRALELYLTDAGKDRFTVLTKADAAPEAAVLFTIEGELSHAESAESEGGAYLCAVRLFKEGTPRRLLGQWAGSAISLRYLTGNLRSVPDVDNAGLVGEIGKRLVMQIMAFGGPSQATTLTKLVDSAAMRPTAKLVIEGKPQTAPGPTLVNGTNYQVEVTAPVDGTAYVVLLDGHGGAHAVEVPEPDHETKVEAGKSALIPYKDRPATADLSHGSPQSLVVLIRKENKGGSTIAPRIVDNGPTPATTTTDNSTGKNPIKILDGGTTRGARSDAAVARLLALAAGDQPGMWLAQRLDFKVTAPP